MVRLEPDTLKQTKLSVSGLGKSVTYTMISNLVGNGGGLYFAQGEILHGYFELDK